MFLPIEVSVNIKPISHNLQFLRFFANHFHPTCGLTASFVRHVHVQYDWSLTSLSEDAKISSFKQLPHFELQPCVFT